MNLDQFHHILDDVRKYSLNSEQRRAVDHPRDLDVPDQQPGPLWLLAGPGSGKSEVLVARTLKLLYVDQIAPRSLLLTTFTKKASRNLEDRLAENFVALQRTDSSLRNIDPSEVRAGTLHSLCNNILQEYRYPGYQNMRLLDEVEQALFLYQRGEITRHDDLQFWRFFSDAVPKWSTGGDYPPGRWKRVAAGVTLFNHLVEDRVVLERLRAEGSHWGTLADLYDQYAKVLKENHRCDYAHLQACFLEFLDSSFGQRFLDGDATHPPLRHVLVDEYQDTNPIQERIYLALAQRPPHNLTVVGDDDQALYRFRGGTVTCMVHFDQACQTVLGANPRQLQLAHNYRSHADIVGFFNNYIDSFPEMRAPGIRAPGKVPIDPALQIEGDYPAVSWLQTKKAGDLGRAFSTFVQDHLIADGIITDLNQCVLLLPTTKDSPGNAGPFLRALEQQGIPVYNPRSKTFMESEEVQCLLAALVDVLDPEHTYSDNRTRDLPKIVNSWFDTLKSVRARGVEVKPCFDYVERCRTEIPRSCTKADPGRPLQVSILEIVYRILSLEPFRTWRADQARNLRLSKVTRLLEGYHSMNLDQLWINKTGTDLDKGFRDRFFYMMVGYLISEGISDDEDEEVIVPTGMLPVMTIHQAKGLQFPLVFVGKAGLSGRPGPAQILDQTLRPFRNDLYQRTERDPQELVVEDEIRLWYVAYSRAQYALILAASSNQLRDSIRIPGRDAGAFRQTMHMIHP